MVLKIMIYYQKDNVLANRTGKPKKVLFIGTPGIDNTTPDFHSLLLIKLPHNHDYPLTFPKNTVILIIHKLGDKTNMHRTDIKNYYKRQKNATVSTPEGISQFLFSVLSPSFPAATLILDPCVGRGSLLKPFVMHGYEVIGIDIADDGFKDTIIKNYLSLVPSDLPVPGMVIMNPPFNVDGKTKEYIKSNYKGRPLLPELWLQKTIYLFGKEIPMILFAPHGLRLNPSIQSKRWQKFLKNEYPAIKSIISLPRNAFPNIEFHCEILIFNINNLKPHYFYDPPQ